MAERGYVTLHLRGIAACACAIGLVGCGGNDHSTPASADALVWTAAAESASTTTLSRAQLKKSLLRVTQLPPGYTKEKTARPVHIDCESPEKSEVPEADIAVDQTYSHAIGRGEEVIIIAIRQFPKAHAARRAFDRLAHRSCPPQQVDGETMTPLRVPAPHIGQASTGLRVMTAGADAALYQVLDGVSIVTTQIADTDGLDVKLLRKVTRRQIHAYEKAAS